MSRSPKSAARMQRQARRAQRRGQTNEITQQTQQENFATVPPVKGRVSKVEPITEGQRRFDIALKRSRIIFAAGPAGTGKTWFAAQRAAEALKERQIRKIVIIRPAIEVEEDLGALPGELEEKFAPYIRPFIDAFEEAFGSGHLEYLMKKKIIEARPLAYLRGSTLKDCWALLDEAQNITPKQMKMFLTRIGVNAKFVITGDVKQSDIRGPIGLVDGMDKTRGIDGVEIVRFGVDEVVRDDICQDIVRAYESVEEPA